MKRAGMLFFSLIFCVIPLFSQAMSVDAGEQAKMIERILKYDRNLSERAGDTIDILFVNFPGDATISESDGEAIIDRFDVLAGKSVNGKNITTHRIKWSDQQVFSDFVSSNSIEIVYLLPADKSQVRPITSISTSLKTVTMSGIIPYLTEYVSIAIAKAGPMTKVFLNPGQSKDEGADFSSDLMKISQIIRPG